MVVCWKLANAVTGLASSVLREGGKERLDQHRLTTQLVAKMVATREQQESLEHMHAQEAVNKFRMMENTEQIRAASKHGIAQKVATPPKREPDGVGPSEADAYQ